MKKYTILKERNDRTREITGTVEELTSYFSYTFEVGHSYNNKIDKHPKTIKSFMTNLQKSLDVIENGSYNPTSIELKK